VLLRGCETGGLGDSIFAEWSRPMDRQILTALEDRLSPHLTLSKSRLRTFSWLIVGMINARTVNLSHIASQFSGVALVASSWTPALTPSFRPFDC